MSREPAEYGARRWRRWVLPVAGTTALATVVAGVVALWGPTGNPSAPGPPTQQARADEPAVVLQRFLSALRKQDLDAVAALTDDPASARETLGRIWAELRPVAVQGTAARVREIDEGWLGPFELSWDLGEGRTWRYRGSLRLVPGGQGLLVHWTPAVVHPRLEDGQVLALREDLEHPALTYRDGTPVSRVPVVLQELRQYADQRSPGRPGWRVVVVDRTGAEVGTLYEITGTVTAPLTTTLDAELQAAAQAAVDAERRPAVLVALHPGTGQLLAVVQNPAADRLGPIAFTGQYQPGSVFGLVTAAAALRTGTVRTDTPLPCPAATSVGGRWIANEGHLALGEVPLVTALARSCDTAVARLAADLPEDALSLAARRFGVGVNHDLAGVVTVTGTVPSAEEVGQRAVDAVGRGEALVSPFGMALLGATVARGDVPTPLLVHGTTTRVLDAAGAPSPAVVSALRTAMREAMTDTAVRRLAHIPGVHGKAGVARYGDGTRAHGWFVGFRSAPAGGLAFAVLVVDADGTAPAVGVAARFLGE
ncbi:MAG TPA: penicillin-binding transpeptidase domain-containing protein [Pseudonocardiaceae bacterium]